MRLSLQVLSDVHTECIPVDAYKSAKGTDKLWKDIVTVKGDIVVLAGDIGNPLFESYWEFIGYVSERCKLVVLVAGNHEYWGNSKNGTETLIRERAVKFKNVRYLNRGYVVLDDIVILGCTLWSYVPPEVRNELQGWAGDFKFVSDCKDADVYNSWHFQDLGWLVETIRNFRRQGMQIVVVTHHTPSFELNFNPAFDVNWREFNFNSDLSFLFSEVKIWAYGHTHFDFSKDHRYRVSNFPTVFVSNQRGYPGKVRWVYTKDFTLELGDIPDVQSVGFEVPSDLYGPGYLSRVQAKVDLWLKTKPVRNKPK
jgi:predicted phosphohydrolase